MSDTSIYRPSDFRRVYVEDQARLAEVVQELSAGDAIGVDLEMGQRLQRRPGGLRRWIHELALIQLASDSLSVVVDPVRVRDLSPLRPLMAGEVRKVFLGGGQDVALLERSDIPAHNIVDVGEVALGLFGRREDGMAALAHRIFGITLDKTVRRTDWLTRPLSAALITYAHRDAELTLLIYRWFQQHHPEALAVHERPYLEPVISMTAPDWLREAISRPVNELAEVAAEHGLNPAEHQAEMVEPVRDLLRTASAPRRINRLLRIAGEYGLEPLVPDIIPLVHSPSATIRASAARALGRLANLEVATPALEELKQDKLEDVRKAAEAALRDLRRPKAPSPPPEADEEPVSSLDDESRATLQQLLNRLQPESEAPGRP